MVFREGRCGEGTDPLGWVMEDSGTSVAEIREGAPSR